MKTPRELLAASFDPKAHMQPEVCYESWWVLDGLPGTYVYPAQHFTEDQARFAYNIHDRDDVAECEMVTGFGARLSAPGYLDCTDWAVFDTMKEAAEYLIDTYADDD